MKKLLRSCFGLALLASLSMHAAIAAEHVAQVAAHHPDRSVVRKPAQLGKADSSLARVLAEYETHAKSGSKTAFSPANRFLQSSTDAILIDARATSDGEQLLLELQALGLVNGFQYRDIVSGRLPFAAVRDALALPGLRSLTASPRPIAHTGSITSQGDVGLRADIARSVYHVDGSGVTVGIVSDAYDTLGGAAADIASGDLPAAGVTVLNGESVYCALIFCIDEGRAMAQIIHDVAPGADILFHSGIDGIAAYASAIAALAASGADVIVDDLLIINEPMFQDGIVAQAVDAVVASGVSYFTAAGNSGRQSHETAFDNSGEVFCVEFFEPYDDCDMNFERVGLMHDFDPTSGVDNYMSLTIPENAVMTIAMQWDQPFGGAGPVTDHDIVLLDGTGETYITISANDNVIMGEGWEALQYDNSEFLGNGTDFNILITYDDVDSIGPPATLLKLVIFGEGITMNEYASGDGTSYGHANAAGAEAVGAAFFLDTPEFGTTPPVLQPYSSAGGTPILFDINGVPLSTPEIRQNPNITAIDGVNTTFFFDDRHGADGIDDFFGTSAAAPHAAAVAALMLEARPGATPDQVKTALHNTAIDMGVAGVDNDSGYGLIRTDAAIAEILALFPNELTGIVGLPDIDGSGIPELGVIMPGSADVNVRDSMTNAVINDIDFGADPGIAIEVIPDLNSNGAPEIAVLGLRPDRNVRVQIKDSLTGAVINNIFYGSAYSAIDMAVLPDTDGNGAPELAVLGTDAGNGIRVQARDALTDVATSTTFYGNNATAIDVRVVPDVNGNGKPEIAMHARVSSSNQTRVQLRDSDTRALIRQMFFGAVYAPQRIVVIDDVTGDGIPELAQLARRKDTGAVRIQVKNPVDGSTVSNAFTGDTDRPVDIVGAGGMIGMLVEDAGGVAKVIKRDALTGAFISNVFMGAIGVPQALVVIDDLDGGGDPEFAALGDIAGQLVIQIKDTVNGAQINTMNVP